MVTQEYLLRLKITINLKDKDINLTKHLLKNKEKNINLNLIKSYAAQEYILRKT